MSISVVISVYCKEKPAFLQQAMESIWDNQTRKPDEIVLIEDGKLNIELYEVLNAWQDKLGSVLKWVQLSENGGLTRALNIGIEQCSGDFIARMDTDDISAPTRFEKQRTFLKANPHIHVIGGSVCDFEDDISKRTAHIRCYPADFSQIKKIIARASPLPHPGVMFRRSVFDDGIRYCEKYRTSQDIELWFRILENGYMISNIPDVVLYSRISDSLISRRSRKKAFKEFGIFWHGTRKLHGITWRLIFPVSRLLFRMLPSVLIKIIYQSKLRLLLR